MIRRIVCALILLWISAPAAAAPTFDAVSVGTPVNGGTSITFAHTLGAGSNRVLVCGASSGGNSVSTTGGTYDGDAMTEVSDTAPSPSFAHMSVFVIKESGGLVTGTANVTITFTVSTKINAGCLSFSDVDQTTPLDALAVTAVTNTTTPTNTITSATGDLVVDFTTCVGGATSGTAGAGQTERIDQLFAADANLLVASHEAGAASVVMSWTLAGANCGSNSTAFNLNATGGGGGSPAKTLLLLGVGP